MRSRTKNLLKNEQIEMLIKANFGENTVVHQIEELKGGMCNSAYVIELGENYRIVLKVSMSPEAPLLWHEGDNMAAEIEAYRLVKEHTTIPVPKVLYFDFSKTLINSRYFFMEYMTGETLKKAAKKISPDNLNRIKQELAGYLTQIHRIKGDYFGYLTTDERRQYGSWKDAYASWFPNILLDAKKHGYSLSYNRIEKVLPKAYEYLETVHAPRLIHNDFWAGNVFVVCRDGEYEIQGITDFERAAWGDPLAEFHFNAGIIKNIWEEPAFWASYAGSGKELSGDDILKIHIYKLYLWLIMLAESYRYPHLFGWGQRLFSRQMAMKSLSALERG